MRWQHQWWSVLVAVGLVGLMGVAAVAAGGEQFLPVLGVREGGTRSFYIPMTNGYIDYVTLLNERDGGINGVKLVWEECETVYDATRGVECYERLKAKGPTGAAAFHPAGTPMGYALIERTTHDQIPLLSMGLGRSDASEGRVFPYVFNPPSNYWSQNTAKIRFIGQRAGGMDKLQGLKIAHVYYDTDYGRETIPMLDTQAAHYGFTVQHLAVTPPGLDQKATWCGTGTHFPLIQDIRTYVYARGKGAGPAEHVGTEPWIWGLLRGLLTAEALRTAMHHFGNQPLTGVQVQWGLEHLTLTAASLKALGAEGLISPFSLSCRDHEGGGGVKFQQWDGTQWVVLTDWMAPDQALVRPLVEASAARYAQEKGITPRDCP
jgi:branched-chain amino acid transport system substrate-binding protein